MAQVIMDHGASGCFGTTMAPSPVGREEKEHDRLAFGSMLP
jgi:hypothetical protein